MIATETTHASVETTSEPIGFWRRAFSLPSMILVLLAVVAFWSASTRYHDPDMWWHLKVGEQIWQTGELPNTDEFSYTTDSHAWIAHQWLPEVSMYGAYLLGGSTGLMLWLCVLATILFGGLYLLCASYSGNAKVALLGGLIGWFFGTISLTVRPLLIGHILLVVVLWLVHLARTRDPRWLWGLPAVFALWVNCHGSFAFGFAVLTTIMVAAHVNLEWGLISSVRWPSDHLRTFRFAFIASCFALLVNPIGLELATYPLNLFFGQGDNLASIDEWRPLNFQEARGMGVFVVITILVLVALTLQKKVRLEEFGTVLLGTYLAVHHSRMVFVFGILAAPVVCRLLADSWRSYDPHKDFPKLNAVIMAVAVVLIWWKFPDQQNLQEQVDQRYPTSAIEFLRDDGVDGRLLNEYGWGGYLIWTSPERKVFIDGRTDIFDWTGVLRDYMRWYTVQEAPNKLLDTYEIDYCLLYTNSPISKVMALLPGWSQVYSDDVAVVFQRDDSPVVVDHAVLGTATGQ
jgi:hypothetical protein